MVGAQAAFMGVGQALVKAGLIEVEFLTNPTALDSVKLTGIKGTAIRDIFAQMAANDIFNNILNQP